MTDEERNGPRKRPDYKVYRSRPRLFRRGGEAGQDPSALRGLVEREAARARRAGERARARLPGGPGARRSRWRRVARWAGIWALFWLLLSIGLFFLSAQIQTSKLDGSARDALAGGADLLADPQTILVIGSDERPKGSREPGANEGPPRADTLMLIRTGGGASRRLSILRDTFAEIPGHGAQKINAAYALGGPALQVRAVESYLGIEVDHLVEVDFEGFSRFIDALGGVRVKLGRCVVSRINGGFRNGGYTLRLRPGTHTLDGRQALALARTRNNLCQRNEDDRTRARRQQLIYSGIRDRITSPSRFPINFLRGPLIAWRAPQAVVSDMGGPTMSQLVLASMIGGDSHTTVLTPTGLGPGGSLVVSEESRRGTVARFLEG